MRVALYVPCYVDRCYPNVARASLQLLRQYCPGDWTISVPLDQTCCGQPLVNMGCAEEATSVAQHFLAVFADYDYVVCPSGSCTSMVRNHYDWLVADDPRYERMQHAVFELCEFLHDVVQLTELDSRCPYKVSVHQGCHGLRELQLAGASERGPDACAQRDAVSALLHQVDGLQVLELQRSDECCGFGGTFAVTEAAVSVQMGKDRLADHQQTGADIITSADMSCLMHMDGVQKRQGPGPRIVHVAEILAGMVT